MRRNRSAKIVATLGPASSDEKTIRALFVAGVDNFRLNFSHGSHEEHRARHAAIRRVEQESGCPIGIILDLQGPKLRVGAFDGGAVVLEAGAQFRLDLDDAPGDSHRVQLPHPEVFSVLEPGVMLLLDDGKLRLEVESCGEDHAIARVKVGGRLSDRKGVNLPGVVLPISAITDKDRDDLAFGLSLGVDWVALSFVQRPEDIDEARALTGSQAQLIAKLEKPAAIERLEAIVERTDAVMVARGDLGVEMPHEAVPIIQRDIVRACRRAGRPVVVATQMLESMVSAPVPTRAEASDVASAIYEGADAVMLSAESAVGKYPVEAVAIMERIIESVERDPYFRRLIDASPVEPTPTAADAVCVALEQAGAIVSAKVVMTYTKSGFSAIRAARQRPGVPILSLTPSVQTARRLGLVWGVQSLHTPEVADETTMTELACSAALREGFVEPGDAVVIAAGAPFGIAGTTNLLRIAIVGKPGGGA